MSVYAAAVEWYWQGKYKDSKKSLSPCHVIHQKSHVYCPGFEQGPPRLEAVDYRLTYNTVHDVLFWGPENMSTHKNQIRNNTKTFIT
jgi:hypothetical protein